MNNEAYPDPDDVMTTAEEMKAELNAEVHICLVFDQLVHGDRSKSLKIIKRILLLDEPLLEAVVNDLLNKSAKEYPLPGMETIINNAIREYASVIKLEEL